MPRFPHPSPTTEGLSDKVYGALIAKARARGGIAHPLNVGDTYLEPYEGARAEAQLTAEHARLHNYSPVQGEPVLLDAITRFLRTRADLDVPRDDLQVMPGGTAGLSIGSPILFSSVAHGSAHDIAGLGVADPGAVIEAVTRLARVNAQGRDRG